jgi:hypothetical protein
MTYLNCNKLHNTSCSTIAITPRVHSKHSSPPGSCSHITCKVVPPDRAIVANIDAKVLLQSPSMSQQYVIIKPKLAASTGPVLLLCSTNTAVAISRNVKSLVSITGVAASGTITAVPTTASLSWGASNLLVTTCELRLRRWLCILHQCVVCKA